MLPFTTDIRVGRIDGEPSWNVSAIVDDTADHSVAPAYLLKSHGISELETRTFSLPNGQQIVRGLGIAHFEIDGRSLPCPVVFGPDDGPFLIGASALSIFNLAADPETRKLEPETFLSLGSADQFDGNPAQPNEIPTATAAAPRAEYRIRLRYSDGTAGEVDLSDLANEGIFKDWRDRKFFETVGFNKHGAIAWGDNIELCPNALYMELTGKPVTELMPTTRLMNRDA